jgi:hypothetical protein
LAKDFEYTIVEPPIDPMFIPAPYEGDVLKHLPGGHDQKDHGSWATGGGEGYLSRSTEKEIRDSISLFQEIMGPDVNIKDVVTRRGWESEGNWDKLYKRLWMRYQSAGMGKNTAMLQAEIDLGRVSWAYRLDDEKASWDEGQARRLEAIKDPTDEWHEASKSDHAAIEQGMEVAKERMSDVMKNGQVTMAASLPVFTQILADGRYKNQFETRSSNGTLDTNARKTGEGWATAVPAGTKLAERPVYGYVTTNETPTSSYKEITEARKTAEAAGATWVETMNAERTARWDSILSVNNYEAEQYGEIRFVLKPEVRSRTTVTIGDSLRAGMLADNLTNPTPNLKNMGLYKQGAPDHTGGLPIARYVEAQIHGGVKVADIERIYAPSNMVDYVESMLKERGLDIPVSPRESS